MTLPALSTVSIEEYYHFESCVLSEAKHEFFDGLVIAMTGGSPLHARLAGEVAYQFHHCLRASECIVYPSDLRVRAPTLERVVYPDVTVVCGVLKLDPTDRFGETVTNPTVIVEVMSPTTMKTDMATKLPAYQSIVSLQSILYVHQTRLVEVWTRMPDREWSWYQFNSGVIDSIGECGAKLDVDMLYDGRSVQL